MVVDQDGAHPARPPARGPTHALGWLDAKTLLVAEGGCGQPETLSAVAWSHGTGTASALVDGVDDRRSPDGAPQRADRGPHAAEPGAAGAARGRRVIAPA